MNINQRYLNMFVRILPMMAKFVLTIYVGRYFQLTDIGAYGLVTGAVMMLSVVVGQDLIYVVSRDIVGTDSATAFYKMRDQLVWYGMNYLALVVIGCICISIPHFYFSPKIIIYTIILTILESIGTITYSNMNALNLQVRANLLFFTRSGFWVIPVIFVCALEPSLRKVDTIFIFWIGGSAISLLATLWLWRDLPWAVFWSRPVDWVWIKAGVNIGSLIWLGMIGLTCGSFADRFIIAHYLNLKYVGIMTFYSAFTNALLTLTQSGVTAYSMPRMIQYHRDNNQEQFEREARVSSRQVAIGSGLMAVSLSIAVPTMSYVLGLDKFFSNSGIFLLLMFGTWIRSNAEIKGSVLIAIHQDRAVWLGNVLFLIPALGGNLILVPLLGFYGIGYNAVISSSFLLLWRRWHVGAVRSSIPHTA